MSHAELAVTWSGAHLSGPPSVLESEMFRIRVFSPPLVLDAPRAIVELVIGDARQPFSLDLRYWRVADYQRQWKAGLSRLLYGAPSSALMTAFRGDDDAPHLMWALWRDNGFVNAQPHCVVSAELADRFDPHEPYAHVG